MSSTLTRAHIADELYRTIGLSHNESAELVEMFFEEILLCFDTTLLHHGPRFSCRIPRYENHFKTCIYVGITCASGPLLHV